MTSIEDTVKKSARDAVRAIEERSIYQRLADAYQDIAEMDFSKSGTVSTGGRDSYGFIPIGQILGAVRQVHAKHGIIVLFGRPEYDPEHGEKRYTYKRQSRDGWETTWTAANGHVHVRIIGRDEDDMIEMDVPCEAQDNSDKLDNKLLTNAMRSLYRSLYSIDEGDATDPESVNVPMEGPTEEQKAQKRAQAQNDPFFGSKKEAVQ